MEKAEFLERFISVGNIYESSDLDIGIYLCPYCESKILLDNENIGGKIQDHYICCNYCAGTFII